MIKYSGHQIPIQHQDPPGSQKDMGPQPTSDEIPTEDGGYQIYKAAGKLQGKKALITGGDSGIGRAIAILFAMEGAESMIVYLEQEEEDAKETRKQVEQRGGTLHLLAADLTLAENCKKAVGMALEKMGTVNILVNNAAYQMMQKSILDIPEYVFSPPSHLYYYSPESSPFHLFNPEREGTSLSLTSTSLHCLHSTAHMREWE